MAINQYGEIVREVGKEIKQKCLENQICDFKNTRKERFEYLLKQVGELQQELRTANTEVSVNATLNKLADIIGELSKDSQFEDIKGGISDIAGTICGVKLHDITRSVLDDMLKKLLERAKEIIEEEKKKENAGKIKKLFLEFAEHSNEIAQVIDINEIFG